MKYESICSDLPDYTVESICKVYQGCPFNELLNEYIFLSKCYSELFQGDSCVLNSITSEYLYGLRELAMLAICERACSVFYGGGTE